MAKVPDLEAVEAERDAANARTEALRDVLERRTREHELTVRERDDAIEARNTRIAVLQRELGKLRHLPEQLEDRCVLMDGMEAKHVHAMLEKNDEIGSLERRIQALENKLLATASPPPKRSTRTPKPGSPRQKPPSKSPRS